MTKVHVICGGNSAEREVSLRSGAAVAGALTAAGFSIIKLDLRDASLDEIVDCDVVFPVLHGMGGEDGRLQAQLESRGVHYVGSDSAASRLCFDKWQYRQVVVAAGLPMAEGALVGPEDYQAHSLAAQPYVLKCPTGGSSIDTYIVRDPAQAPHGAIAETFQRYPKMLLEQLILGTEMTIGVLNEQSLPAIEIIPPADKEFDYENKYNGATRELCPPVNVSEDLQQQAQALALHAHQLTGCRDFSRTDIMLDEAGSLYLLETNTIPGMTDQSLFPKAAHTAGLSMQELCKQLVELALTR